MRTPPSLPANPAAPRAGTRATSGTPLRSHARSTALARYGSAPEAAAGQRVGVLIGRLDLELAPQRVVVRDVPGLRRVVEPLAEVPRPVERVRVPRVAERELLPALVGEPGDLVVEVL